MDSSNFLHLEHVAGEEGDDHQHERNEDGPCRQELLLSRVSLCDNAVSVRLSIIHRGNTVKGSRLVMAYLGPNPQHPALHTSKQQVSASALGSHPSGRELPEYNVRRSWKLAAARSAERMLVLRDRVYRRRKCSVGLGRKVADGDGRIETALVKQRLRMS